MSLAGERVRSGSTQVSARDKDSRTIESLASYVARLDGNRTCAYNPRFATSSGLRAPGIPALSFFGIRTLFSSTIDRLTLMFRGFFNRIMKRKLVSSSDYSKNLARYRKEHPESLAEESEQIYQWVRSIDKKKREGSQTEEKESPLSDQLQHAWAVYRMWETARAAFMSHPAATEVEFRRCWPSIRAELLKQHALDELAGNPSLTNRLVEEVTASDQVLSEPYSSTLDH